MVNQKDILARLQAGESADVIAQELVDALNAANAEFAAEQEKASTAKAKAEYIEEIGSLIKDYILEFHAGSAVAEAIADQEIDASEIVEMIDAAFEQLEAEVRKLKEFEKMLKGIMDHADHVVAHNPQERVATGKIEPNVDALGAFLKANGLA